MSLSEAQLAANRANAQQSTGPKTDAGKDRVARNALKHGLRSNQLVVADGEREEFETLRDGLQATVMPNDPIEWVLFNEVVRASWNLRRIDKLEAELFADSTDPLADEKLDARMDRYARYRTRYERTFHRSLRELKALQTANAARATYEAVTGQTLPCLVDIAKVYKQTQQIYRDAGDSDSPVPSAEEIDAVLAPWIGPSPIGGPAHP